MTSGIERIAIVRLGAIGDTVNCLPFVDRLRAGLPRARITWVIGPTAHALLEGHPAIDEFLVFEARRPSTWTAFVRELRRRRFDLAIDLQRITKSGLLTRATGAPRRLGFDRARCKERSFVFTNERIAPNPRPGLTVEQYLEFADHLGLPPRELAWNLPFERFVPEDARAPRVVLNLGASRPSKTWYPDHWARLAERLVADLAASVHLSGGREDRAVAEQVTRLARVTVEDHVGKLPLKKTAGLIADADVLVACDTGPLHVAAALGTPCVALFGATDPRRTGPYGARHRVVTHPVACSPCRRRTCNVAGHPCMRDLSPELVLAAVRDALEGARAGAR